MSIFADRTQLERDLPLQGKAARLYASCGRSDDYLELAFPDDPDLVASVHERLSQIDPGTGDYAPDIRFHEGPPATVSMLALYTDSSQRALPRGERLRGLLVQLAHVLPDLDFGDLLPDHAPAALGSRETAGASPLKQPEAPSPSITPEQGGTPAQATTETLSVAAALPAIEAAREEPTVPAVAEPSPAGDAAPQPAAATQPSMDAEDSMQRARELARRGHTHKVLRLLEELLRNQDSSGAAWKLREEIRLLERREKRRQREPRSGQANLEVGFSYLVVERNRDAAEALAVAIRLAPGVYLSHLLLGIALHREGERDAARAAYQRAAQLRPEAEEVHSDLLRALEMGDPPMPLTESGRDIHRRPQPRAARPWARAV